MINNLTASSSVNSFGSQPNSFGSANWADLFSAMKIEFETILDNPVRNDNIKELYKIRDVPANSGKYIIKEEVDKNIFSNIKPEAGYATTLQAGATYSITITPFRFGIEYSLTWEGENWGKDRSVLNYVKTLANNIQNRFMLDLSHRISFGGQSTYVNMDGISVNINTGAGQPLFFATQPCKYSPIVWSNILTAQPFTRTALEAIINQANTNTVNNFGEKKSQDYNYNVIWMADDERNKNAISELLHSTSTVTLNQNAGVTNVYNGVRYDGQSTFRMMMFPRVATDAFGSPDTTKKGYWGIAALADGEIDNSFQAWAYIWERPNLTTPVDNPSLYNARTGVYTFVATGAWGTGFTTAKGILACLYTG